MIEHCELYNKYIRAHGVSVASTKSYIAYLKRVCNELSMSINPETLKSQDDIENISEKLKVKKVPKNTIRNLRTAMRHYICMVKTNNLT